MSDDMTTHKRGRRAIRRLTRRKIPLPMMASGNQPPGESAQLELGTSAANDSAEERPTIAPDADRASDAQAAIDESSVATSLSELRLPDVAAGDAASNGAAADGGEAAAAADNELSVTVTTSIVPDVSIEEPDAVSGPAVAGDEAADKVAARAARGAGSNGESNEDEPTTNPHIRVDESLRAALVAGSKDTSVDAADAEGAQAAAKLASEGASASTAASSEEEPDFEPVTGQHSKQAPPAPAPRRKPDSDAPTRPRIELSSEMALAAGRVTSLEMPPVRSEQPPPRRGSKLPPPGGERVVSSLTGRRSSAFPAADDDDAAARPAVVVTRSRIISDRPPKVHDADSIKSARLERESAKRDGIEPQKRAAAEADKRAAVETAADDDLVATGESEIPEPETAEIARPDLVEPTLPSLRPSRKPSAEGDEFETLDIEESEVETHSLRAEAEIDAEFDDDEPTKAPPPPPQHKRAAVPSAGGAPAPPKAAPPPPPRVQGVQGPAPLAASSASAAVATSMPAPTMPGTAAPVAAVASGSALISAAVSSSAAAAPPARKAGAGTGSGGRPQPRRRQWWETLFSDDYLRTMVRPTPQQIARQVDFMHASLGVAKGAAVLDVGCGLGQHALEFARRGCLVVALDLALPMITRAAEDAQQEGLRINFLHKDIRDIGFEGTFDAVICVGTTFGFFDDEQNREVLGRLANALKPGGRLLLEVVNRDHVLPSQPNLQWFEGDGCVVMEESDFNYYSSRLTVKRTMMREDGRQTETEYSIRLYALHELGQMMQSAGFRVKEVSGAHATRGVFFGAQSSRIILLAERRTPAQARGNNGHSSDAPAPADS